MLAEGGARPRWAESGSVSAEYVAIIVIVGALIAAVSGLGIAGQVSLAGERSVCRLFASDTWDCPDEASSTSRVVQRPGAVEAAAVTRDGEPFGVGGGDDEIHRIFLDRDLGHGRNPVHPRFGANILDTGDSRGHSGYFRQGTQNAQNAIAIIEGDYHDVRCVDGRSCGPEVPRGR